MNKQQEALRLALEALEGFEPNTFIGSDAELLCHAAITAIREALAEPEEKYRYGTPLLDAMTGNAEQPAQEPCIKCKGLGYYDEGHECYDGSMAGGNYVECDKCKQPDFIKHEVENAYDWSEWVCPDPESYLMKCCDCGLVHEAQFRVAKYKPAPSDECEVVSDPDLQAQFRMRRSEQWSPADTAHRPGGLPMAEQPAQQQEPFGYFKPEPFGWTDCAETDEGAIALYERPQPSKPLTDDEIDIIYTGVRAVHHDIDSYVFARAIEAKLKEKNNG